MASAAETKLEELLAAAATDATQVSAFLTALLDSTVIVPGYVVEGAPGEGQTVNLLPLTDPSGAQAQPFYTSEDRLQETIARIPGFDPRYLGMSCRALWEMTEGATLVLNPHSSSGKEFLPGEVRQLLSGSAGLTRTVIERDTTVFVGEPADVPAGMKETLATLFGRYSAVEGGYLGWKVSPDGGDQSYLLVIVGSPDVRELLAEELSRTLVYYSRSHPVDVVYASPKGGNLLSSIDPFYSKMRTL